MYSSVFVQVPSFFKLLQLYGKTPANTLVVFISLFLPRIHVTDMTFHDFPHVIITTLYKCLGFDEIVHVNNAH